MKKIKLEKIEIREFSLEREIQQITKDNLKQIFDLDYLCSEFKFGPHSNPGQNRIDILAFDRKLKSFVIIKCKDRTISGVIGQEQDYFDLMEQYDLKFYAEYQKQTANAIPASDIEWLKSRVILITTGYDNRQRYATDDDSRVELWEVRKYENNTISFNRVDKAAPKDDSEYMFAMKEEVHSEYKNLLKKTHEYDPIEKERIANASEEIADLYEKFRDGVLNLDKDITVTIKINTNHMIFVVNSNSIIVSIQIQRQRLKMWVNMPRGKLIDLKKMTDDVFDKGRDGAGGYQVFTNSHEDLGYILSLVRQSLEYHNSKKKTKEGYKNPIESLTKGERKHLTKVSREVKSLYNRFRDGIQLRRNVEIVSQAKTINYFIAKSRIISIAVQKRQLKIWIDMPKGELNDPRQIMRDISKIGSWTSADYEKVIFPYISDRDFKYILRLIKQSFKYHRSKIKASSVASQETMSLSPKMPAKIWTEEDHFKERNEYLVNLYGKFKSGILGLSDAIGINPRETYLGFDTDVNIVGIKIYVTQLAIWINMPKETLEDPMGIMRDVDGMGHHGKGSYQINVKSDENLEYILSLVGQSLEYKGKR